MAKFQNPGAFFLGTLVAQEQKFLKPLIENARKQGYTRFVEPCAGAFAMSHIAAQCGYKPGEIEASDVSMFTSIMGYAHGPAGRDKKLRPGQGCRHSVTEGKVHKA